MLVGGGLGACTKTLEGKVIAASYLDNWNTIVHSTRNNPERAYQKINFNGKSGQPAKAGMLFDGGDTKTGKIAGLTVTPSPRKSSR
ncbi:hypothetical protein [Thiobacillus sp.]